MIDGLDEARAAVLEAGKIGEYPGGWRFIHTAPRDGRIVLVRDGGDFSVYMAFWYDDEWLFADCDGSIDDDRTRGWMPEPT